MKVWLVIAMTLLACGRTRTSTESISAEEAAATPAANPTVGPAAARDAAFPALEASAAPPDGPLAETWDLAGLWQVTLPTAVTGLSLAVCGDGSLRANVQESGKASSAQIAQGSLLASDPPSLELRGYADLASLEAMRERWTFRGALIDGARLEGTLELTGEPPRRIVLDRWDAAQVRVLPRVAIARAVAHVKARPAMLDPAPTGLCISENGVAPEMPAWDPQRTWSISVPRHDPANPTLQFRPADLWVEIRVTDGALRDDAPGPP
jgi:hypothetical protein